MKSSPLRTLLLSLPLLLHAGLLQAAPTPPSSPVKIIFDTDFVIPPQDDSMALILSLKSPELEIVGVTTVAGNGLPWSPKRTCLS